MNDVANQCYRNLLVVRCQAGDRVAFEELVGACQPRLRYFLRKMLHERHRVDDVFQDVWLDVFRGIGKLAHPAAFPAWLYRLARHRVYRELRGRRPPCPQDLIDLADEAAGDDDFSAEDAEEIHAALDRLGPEHHEVLLLRFMEEMSYDDIARVTGCPVGTVRSRLYHAKCALRGTLERMRP
jgi:RNA polymerase sigma-70 factor (ECF subfamily)